MTTDRKIKVLHIITRLDAGGSSTSVIETAARLDTARYEIVVISGRTYDPRGDIQSELKHRDIHCIFIDDLRRDIQPWSDLKAFFKLYSLIRRGHFDIVHTHSSKAGILGRWAAWFARTNIIVHTPHGHVFYGYFNKFLTNIFIRIERFTALITDKIITLTDIGKQDHVRFTIAGPGKFVTIYSGIDIEKFKRTARDFSKNRTALNVPPDGYIFGTVARLDPIKGVEYLIEAMAEVVACCPQARLLIIGDGTQRVFLEEQCRRLNLSGHVIFKGHQKDVLMYLHMMDAFVLASLNEGMGRVILEAMACGKPVVATRTGGIPELVEDGRQGYLVAVKDAWGLAQGMLKLIQQPQEAKRLGENAAKKVTGHFSLTKMVEDIDHLYAELLDEKIA